MTLFLGGGGGTAGLIVSLIGVMSGLWLSPLSPHIIPHFCCCENVCLIPFCLLLLTDLERHGLIIDCCCCGNLASTTTRFQLILQQAGEHGANLVLKHRQQKLTEAYLGILQGTKTVITVVKVVKSSLVSVKNSGGKMSDPGRNVFNK